MAEEITSSPPPPPVPQPAPRTAPAAIWSLILAILSFTCGSLPTAIPAVICGHVARSKIRKSGGNLGGMGIATAGLILGYIALALGVMGIPLLVSMIQSDRGRLHRLSIERKEIVSNDGKINWSAQIRPLFPKRASLRYHKSLRFKRYSSEKILVVYFPFRSTVTFRAPGYGSK